MKRIFIILTMIIMIGVLTEGCYYDNEEELYPITDSTEITFQKNIKPIIDNNCAISGCHVAGGAGSGIFTTYSGIKEKVENGSFHQRVIVEKNMPPSQPLSNAQLQTIQAWLDAGALNN